MPFDWTGHPVDTTTIESVREQVTELRKNFQDPFINQAWYMAQYADPTTVLECWYNEGAYIEEFVMGLAEWFCMHTMPDGGLCLWSHVGHEREVVRNHEHVGGPPSTLRFPE